MIKKKIVCPLGSKLNEGVSVKKLTFFDYSQKSKTGRKAYLNTVGAPSNYDASWNKKSEFAEGLETSRVILENDLKNYFILE